VAACAVIIGTNIIEKNDMECTSLWTDEVTKLSGYSVKMLQEPIKMLVEYLQSLKTVSK